jgi:hypothetical protein
VVGNFRLVSVSDGVSNRPSSYSFPESQLLSADLLENAKRGEWGVIVRELPSRL